MSQQQQAQSRPVIKQPLAAAASTGSSSQQPRPQVPASVAQQVSRAAPTAMAANPLQPRQSAVSAPATSAATPATAGAAQPPRTSAPASASVVARTPAPAASAAPAAPAPTAQYVQTPIVFNNIHYRRCSIKARDTADNIAILKDRPILLDYWIPSLEKKAFIALTSTGDKHLVISKYDYTSKIKYITSVSNTNDIIVETENSIYIVAKGIECKRYEIPKEYYDDNEEGDVDHKDT